MLYSVETDLNYSVMLAEAREPFAVCCCLNAQKTEARRHRNIRKLRNHDAYGYEYVNESNAAAGPVMHCPSREDRASISQASGLGTPVIFAVVSSELFCRSEHSYSLLIRAMSSWLIRFLWPIWGNSAAEGQVGTCRTNRTKLCYLGNNNSRFMHLENNFSKSVLCRKVPITLRTRVVRKPNPGSSLRSHRRYTVWQHSVFLIRILRYNMYMRFAVPSFSFL